MTSMRLCAAGPSTLLETASIIDRVAEHAICQPIGYDEFERTVGAIATNLKSAPPDYLTLPQSYTTAIKIYEGWIEC